jgi:hypothetical protein
MNSQNPIKDNTQQIASLAHLAKTNNIQIQALTKQIQAKRAAVSRIASAKDHLDSKLEASNLLADARPWTASILEISTRADSAFSDTLLKMNCASGEDAAEDEDLLMLLMNGVDRDGVGAELVDEIEQRLGKSRGRVEGIQKRVKELVVLCDGLEAL